MADNPAVLRQTATHWGVYDAEVSDGRVVRMHAFSRDPEPSRIGHSLPSALDDEVRIRRPMVRKSYLERGRDAGGDGRGAEPFVAVDWDTALDLAAGALAAVKQEHGNGAIYGGSYGWASAGRFHHAQSQVHRFLNLHGGYVASVNTYSYAAMEVIVPHILCSIAELRVGGPIWAEIARHAGLVVAFGGLAIKNSQINAGGVGSHRAVSEQLGCRGAGVEFVNVSPLRGDAIDALGAQWLALRPGSDTALMLGLAHTLLVEDLHDKDFLARCCTGFDRFAPYLLGTADGCPKDAEWAAGITGLDAGAIRDLARRIAGCRTLITASWSLQRGDHGEQAYWMAVTLAAMSGSMGKPGGGFGAGYGAVHGIGMPPRVLPVAALPQGRNAVADFIPVARISDMLLNPGGRFDYNGRALTYPDIRLVYWCGGNPFHHHQDINRLLHAWRRPETVIVHEIWWNSLARHADIVLPATTVLERNDFTMGTTDGFLTAMHQAIEPVGDARNDYDIFRGLSRRLGFEQDFTEGKDEMEWVRALYARTREAATRGGIELPPFEDFWARGHVELPMPEQAQRQQLCRRLSEDPQAHPIATPSGKVEIFSEAIAGFGYDDCRGHPTWFEPGEWLGSEIAIRFPLHLISNQPLTRLHSQLDNGNVSRSAKIADREPLTMHPLDAASRNIANGDVVRVFNDRGACLAGVHLSDAIRPGVVQIATGAWYDPLVPGEIGSLCVHGNPNVLTRDKGTSRLAQGPTAHSCLVEIERFDGSLPPVKVFSPPAIEEPLRDVRDDHASR